MSEESKAQSDAIDRRLAAAPTNRLVMRRRFNAPPERVFDAWLKPEIAGKWLFTSPTSERSRHDLPARVDSKWTIMDRRQGVEYTAEGWYLEIDRPRRLVFTFGMPQFSPDFDRVIVEFAPDGEGGCLMTFTQEGIAEEYKAPTEHGWTLMFDDALRPLVETKHG